MSWTDGLKEGDIVLVETYGLGGGVFKERIQKISGKKRRVIVTSRGDFDSEGFGKKRGTGFSVSPRLLEPTEDNLHKWRVSYTDRVFKSLINNLYENKNKISHEDKHRFVGIYKTFFEKKKGPAKAEPNLEFEE